MKITAHSPKWSNADHTAIDLLVTFPWIDGEVPFTATLNDTDYATELFNAAFGGDFGVIEPYAAPIVVPQKVSRFQALAALYQAGLLDDIKAYMADPATDGFTKLAWEEAQEFNRPSPLVASIGALFGLTEAQMDDLFRFASTITA